MPIECAEVFSKMPGGGVPSSSRLGPKNDLDDYDADSDFEVLMKTAHGHLVPDRIEKEAVKSEFNNHKDYTQEKPSRLKQRSSGLISLWYFNHTVYFQGHANFLLTVLWELPLHHRISACCCWIIQCRLQILFLGCFSNPAPLSLPGSPIPNPAPFSLRITPPLFQDYPF